MKFLTCDTISISGVCKIRRVFTLKHAPPASFGNASEVAKERAYLLADREFYLKRDSVPRAHNLPPCASSAGDTVLINWPRLDRLAKHQMELAGVEAGDRTAMIHGALSPGAVHVVGDRSPTTGAAATAGGGTSSPTLALAFGSRVDPKTVPHGGNGRKQAAKGTPRSKHRTQTRRRPGSSHKESEAGLQAGTPNRTKNSSSRPNRELQQSGEEDEHGNEREEEGEGLSMSAPATPASGNALEEGMQTPARAEATSVSSPSPPPPPRDTSAHNDLARGLQEEVHKYEDDKAHGHNDYDLEERDEVTGHGEEDESHASHNGEDDEDDEDEELDISPGELGRLSMRLRYSGASSWGVDRGLAYSLDHEERDDGDNYSAEVFGNDDNDNDCAEEDGEYEFVVRLNLLFGACRIMMGSHDTRHNVIQCDATGTDCES